MAWGFRNTLKAELKIGVVFDRDYRCEEELTQLKADLEKEVDFVHFHNRKEVENYLLIGRLTALWGRLTASWDFQWTPAGLVGSIAHRQAA